jgi:hypothetical protein
VHVCRARTDGVLRHPERLSDAVGALEGHAARGLRAADEDDVAQVVEGVGGPVEDRERMRAMVGVSSTLAITLHSKPYRLAAP